MHGEDRPLVVPELMETFPELDRRTIYAYLSWGLDTGRLLHDENWDSWTPKPAPVDPDEEAVPALREVVLAVARMAGTAGFTYEDVKAETVERYTGTARPDNWARATFIALNEMCEDDDLSCVVDRYYGAGMRPPGLKGPIRVYGLTDDDLAKLDAAGFGDLAGRVRSGAWAFRTVEDEPLIDRDNRLDAEDSTTKVAARVLRTLTKAGHPLSASQIKQQGFGGSGGQRELVDAALALLLYEGQVERDGNRWTI